MKRTTLLPALLLIASLLFGCEAEPVDPVVTDPADTIATADPAVTTEPLAADYDLIRDGKTDYRIIRAEVLSAEAVESVTALWSFFGERGISIPVSDDWSADNRDHATVTSDSTVREILIGETNRAESRSTAAEYRGSIYGYVIRATNGKIVIWGSDDQQTARGIRAFIESLPNEQTITVAHDYLLVSDLGENNMLSDILAHDFTIVLPDALRDRFETPADKLAKQLSKISGSSPAIVSDKTAAKSYEILVGLTNRPESVEAEADLKYMDYRIRLAGDKIILTGGSALSTLTAMEHFTELLTSAELPTLASGYEYHLDFHNTYLANLPAYDFDSFVPVWASEFTTPDWMLDYEEKLYAMTTQSGRFTSISHRADIQNYPCNSIGGILSALKLGIDAIELDIRLTKDNVMILMHDPTLSRTTNWEKMNGKNGLPTSCNVEDWTYAELLQLNLTYKGRETEFKVPTLYEAAALFKGRAQIWLDLKVGISEEHDLYPLMEELGIKASCLYWLRMNSAKEWLQMNPGDTEYKAFIQKMTNYINRPGNKLRSSSYSKVGRYGDDPEGWKMQFTTGSKMVFTNRVYDLCRYIAENQAPIYP